MLGSNGRFLKPPSYQGVLQAPPKGPKQRKGELPWLTSIMLLYTQGGEGQVGEPCGRVQTMSLEAGAGQQTRLSLDSYGCIRRLCAQRARL